jgi:surface antigen
MKKVLAFSLVAVAGLAAGGCSQTTGPKEDTGAILGAVAGGLIGSQFGGGTGQIFTTAAGALAGAAIGGAIGAALDEQDREEMARITTASFESGREQRYTSAHSGARLKVHIVKTAKTDQKVCRTAAQEVTLKDGTQSSQQVTACKAAGGSWVVG